MYFGTIPYREELHLKRIDAGVDGVEFREKIPFTDKPGRLLARKWLASRQGSAEDALYHIKQSIKNRPLYAHSWLDLAEINIRLKKYKEAGEYIDIATDMWPNHRILLWRAAMLWLQIGEENKVFAILKRYIRARPGHLKRAVVVGARFETNPERLIKRLVPEEPPYDKQVGYYMEQLLIYAINQNNADLANAAWLRFSEKSRKDKKILSKYIDYMIRTDDGNNAVNVFLQYTGGHIKDDVFNGGFENKLLNFGFGWIAKKNAGVSLTFDTDYTFKGNQSLRIDFDGTTNLDYRHLYQRILVEPGGRYQLKGMWRGEGISTRSNPYLEMFSIGAKKNSRTKTQSKRQSWRWQLIQAELQVPEDSSFITVRMRRRKADALDNKISGSIWLDELHIVKLED